MSFRVERDPLGDFDVPADAYYGVQTARARENFQISGLTAPGSLIRATILVKRAAAEANQSSTGCRPDRRTPSSRPQTKCSADSSAISS